MTNSVKIVFAEDKALFRKHLLDALCEFHVECIGEASNGRELLALPRLWDADVILLDLEMPLMDGNQTMDALIRCDPKARILVMSFHYEPLLIEDYMRRGALGYLCKDAVCGNIELLVNALHQVKYGQPMRPVKTENKSVKFTQRQSQIIPLICDECTNKEIAGRLGISERGVEKQRQKIYDKAGATGTASFLKYAFRKGLDFLSRGR